jgi:hypothetical protein
VLGRGVAADGRGVGDGVGDGGAADGDDGGAAVTAAVGVGAGDTVGVEAGDGAVSPQAATTSSIAARRAVNVVRIALAPGRDLCVG